MSNIAKFLMLLLIGVVIAVISLWLVGGKKQAYEAKVSIDAPAPVIFRYLIDGKERKRWQVGLIECNPTSDTKESVGSRTATLVEVDGEQVEYESILQQQNERDQRDQSRPVGKLIKADDAVEVNTDGLSLDEVVERITEIFRARTN